MATEFDEAATTKLLHGIDIPPRPLVLQIVMQEQQRPDPDLRRIATAISQDVGMSAAMLRAANSPAFGLRQKVSSISQAVMLLGVRNSSAIVTGLSLRMAMTGKKRMNLDRFWDTASDTATVSAWLARRFSGLMLTDHAYMLGLFHDCGIPLMMQRFPNYIEVLQKANANIQELCTAIEDQHFSTNHAVVGYLVARSWFLPEEVRNVILHHHDEELLATAKDDLLASHIAILSLAEHYCHFHNRVSDDVIWIRTGERVLAILEVSQTDFQDMREDVDDLLSKH